MLLGQAKKRRIFKNNGTSPRLCHAAICPKLNLVLFLSWACMDRKNACQA